MTKRPFSTELAYVLGIISLALGTAFMAKADFGVSMVVAPAYLLYLKLSPTWSFVTFGVAEYTVQALLLLIMTLILWQFKLSYLFSFCTAVFYGLALDGFMLLTAPIGTTAVAWRIVFYLIGLLLGALGVSLIFHTYIAPEVYELFVKRVSTQTGTNINTFKIAYDCISCLTAIILSFLFFGFLQFEGVKWGTVLCALINGKLIGSYSTWLENRLDFVDRLPLRRYFQ